jgi:MFS superfamily sulfate permease-like transporter
MILSEGSIPAGVQPAAATSPQSRVVAVAALVVFANVLFALGVGLLAAFARFLYQSSSRIVYCIGSAIHHRSRMERPHPSLEALMQYGERIAIIELQGPI